MASWDAWARTANCAVLLIAHPAKAASGEAADYSGSTDWRNAARAAWTMGFRDDDPVLTLDKSSYGPPLEPKWLEAAGTVWFETTAPENAGRDDDPDRCRETQKDGRLCRRDAWREGLCKQHWRMMNDHPATEGDCLLYTSPSPRDS